MAIPTTSNIEKKYFFVLGRSPGLSLLEINAALSSNVALGLASWEIAIASGNLGDARSALSRLGGTIKIGVCETEVTTAPLLNDTSIRSIADGVAKTHPHGRKLTVGLSVYSLARNAKLTYGSRDVQRIGITLKKELRSRGYSLRVVLPQKGSALTSVQVDKNSLTGPAGIEVVLIIGDEKILIGSTAAVQEFEAYSYRDWQRPSKETARGMLPPKLAQIMINLAVRDGKDAVRILDPFCGSGTVVQEALLMGYRDAAGSDVDEKAVAHARKNLEWLSQTHNVPISPSHIISADASRLDMFYPKHLYDAIVTEPYLGPLYTRMPNSNELQKTIQELTKLYLAFLRRAKIVLKESGRICMVWPVWIQGNKHVFLPILEEVEKLDYCNVTIPQGFPFTLPERTERNTILITRPDAVVGRELFVFIPRNEIASHRHP